MKNAEGILLTSEDDIQAEAVKLYKEVFKNKSIDDELRPHEIEREETCSERLKSAYQNKTPAWTVTDVKNATKGLNIEISKDP